MLIFWMMKNVMLLTLFLSNLHIFCTSWKTKTKKHCIYNKLLNTGNLIGNDGVVSPILTSGTISKPWISKAFCFSNRFLINFQKCKIVQKTCTKCDSFWIKVYIFFTEMLTALFAQYILFVKGIKHEWRWMDRKIWQIWKIR